MLAAAWITAVATGLLAILAGVTAWYARNAFVKQSEEVRAIERQVKDQEELTRQQAELLKVQSGQLELQRHQLDDQRQANARQAEVLELQAAELRESLEERKREAEQRRREQASQVFIHIFHVERVLTDQTPAEITARVENESNKPIHDVELRWRRASSSHGDPNPEPLGTLMPGSIRERRRQFPADTKLDVSLAVLRFRDASGITWTRRADVELTEQQP